MPPARKTSGSDSRGGRYLPRRIAGLVMVLIVLSWVAYEECTPRRPSAATLTVYAASTLQETLLDAVLPAFQRDWETRTGQHVDFVTAFGGSGEITDRILRRVPVSVALLSSELDALRLAEHGIVAGPSWRRLPNRGVFCRSPMVIVVRPGNPQGIGDFPDLARGDIELTQPDPRRSAAGEWSLLSVYSAMRTVTGDEREALALVERLRARIAHIAPSARAARLAFESGVGSAMITYEKETIDPGGIRLDRIYPPTTLMSEHVACRIDRHVADADSAIVDALIAFLWSERAQDEFVRHGFRGVDPLRTRGDPRFGEPGRVVTFGELGGAERVRDELIGKLQWTTSDPPKTVE